jgi:FkbM family methyltransferase
MAHKLIASYLNIGTVEFPMDILLRNGAIVRVSGPGEAKVFWQIFIHQCYRLWADCKTIVDAGANIGIFSVWAALQLPESRILALEPFPETFRRLQHNVRSNRLEPRVEVQPLALGARSEERTMPAAGESQRRGLMHADQQDKNETAVKVISITLADLLDRYHLSKIDLLKMDIEGSEWEVLLSTPAYIFRAIQRIQFEYHEVHARFGYSKRGLFEHLRSAGYNLTYCREDEQHTGIAIVEQASTPAFSKPLKIPHFSKVRGFPQEIRPTAGNIQS